jgi:hypothetical protein
MKPLSITEYGDKSAPRLGVRLSTDTTPGYGSNHGYRHLQASVVEIVEGPSVRNLSDRQPLCDVGVRFQLDDTSKAFYGREVCVQTSYTHIGIPRAKVILATLQTIQRRLDQIEAKYGYADSSAAYLLRFADAVGAEVFITGETGNDGTYRTGTWHEMEPYIAQTWISEREREGVEAFATVA